MRRSTFTTTILPLCGCVILGPGPGSPHRQADFSWPTRLIQTYGHHLPILGLCLGHQGLATAFGGRVGPAAAPRHGQLTRVRHTGEGLFEGIPAQFEVVQYNSLTVKEEGLPDGLEVVAWGDNQGREEVLALRHTDKPLWGVQFHPEVRSALLGATASLQPAWLISLKIFTCSRSRLRSGPGCCPTSSPWPSRAPPRSV